MSDNSEVVSKLGHSPTVGYKVTVQSHVFEEY